MMTGAIDIKEAAPVREKAVGPWLEGWRSFKKSKVSLVGAGIVIFLFYWLSLVHTLHHRASMNKI